MLSRVLPATNSDYLVCQQLSFELGFAIYLVISMINQSKAAVTGLILAGGRASRLGGKDKGFMMFEGQVLIERQLGWIGPQVSQVLISANRSLEEYAATGYSVVIDKEVGFQGPLHGVLSGLQQSASEWLFVHPVDLPFLPPDVVAKMFAARESNLDCYFLCSDEREHYLSMMLSKKLLPQLQVFITEGGKRVRDFLSMVGAKSLHLGITEACFKNLNEPADYDASTYE